MSPVPGLQTRLKPCGSALNTSMGKIADAHLVAIGTRPAAPDHFFAQLLDGGADTSLCYSAAPDADPLDEGRMARSESEPAALPRPTAGHRARSRPSS